MFTNTSKDNLDIYNFGILGIDQLDQQQEKRKLSSISITYQDRLQNSNFGLNNGQYSPKSENQLDQINTNTGLSNSLQNSNNISSNQVFQQNSQPSNKLNNVQQQINQNIMNAITQTQQNNNSQNINQSPIQNSNNATLNTNQLNNQNITASPQILYQQINPQLNDPIKNNPQSTPQQITQNSVFSENIVDSPVKAEKKEIKTNLINANAVVNSLSSSIVLKRNEKINESLLALPNIVRPPILQNNQLNTAQENFRKELEQKNMYTPYKQIENEFILEEKQNYMPIITKIQSQSNIPKYVRQKIFQDSQVRPSNSQDRLSEISRIRQTHQQSQVYDGEYFECEFQEQEGYENTYTPKRELQRNDTARSTLSQQKYRKNQLLQEINPSKLITQKNALMKQQGIKIQPQSTNEIIKCQEQEDNLQLLLNKQLQPSPSILWSYHANGYGLVKANKSFLNKVQVCQELEKTEDTKEEIKQKANLNEQARYKLREVILEEAKNKKQKKLDEISKIQELQQVRELSANQKKSLLNNSPMKFTEDWNGKQGISSNNRMQTEQGINRQNNKENQQQSFLSNRQNDKGSVLSQSIFSQQTQYKTGQFINSIDTTIEGQQGNLDKHSPSDIANMIILQKTKKNIFQPTEQQNFEKDRINGKVFKNEYRLQEQQNLGLSYTPNKKNRKQIFQPIDTKASIERFDKLNSQFQQVFQDEDFSGITSFRDQESNSFTQLSSPLKKSLNQLHSHQMQTSRIGGQQNYMDSSRVYNHYNSDFSLSNRNPSHISSNNDRISSQYFQNRPPAGHLRSQSSNQQIGTYQNPSQRFKVAEEQQINQSQQLPKILITNEPEFQLTHRTISFQN